MGAGYWNTGKNRFAKHDRIQGILNIFRHFKIKISREIINMQAHC